MNNEHRNLGSIFAGVKHLYSLITTRIKFFHLSFPENLSFKKWPNASQVKTTSHSIWPGLKTDCTAIMVINSSKFSPFCRHTVHLKIYSQNSLCVCVCYTYMYKAALKWAFLSISNLHSFLHVIKKIATQLFLKQERKEQQSLATIYLNSNLGFKGFLSQITMIDNSWS